MTLRSSVLLICTLVSVAAIGNKDSNQLILDEDVTATFVFNGKYQRVWSEYRNPEYFNSSLENWRFFYEPVIVPFVSTENQTVVILSIDPSMKPSNRHKAKIILSTNSDEVHNLAHRAVKMALKRGAEIKKANVQPLPIMKLNLTLSGLYNDPPNSDNQCRFRKTFETPGPTVELVITTDSEQKANHIARLLENDSIFYSMDVDLDRKIKRQTVSCKNGKVEVFGLIKGRINLAHIQSQRLLSVNEKLQKYSEIKEKELKNSLKENQDHKKGFQTKIQQMQEKIVQLTEDKTKIDKVYDKMIILEEYIKKTQKNIEMKEEALAEEKKKTHNIHEKMLNLEGHLTTIRKMVGCFPGWTAACFLDSCSCYRIFNDTKSWNDASKSCESFGSELASIQSDHENSFIHKLAKTVSNKDFWIGLNDLTQEGLYQWKDGTSLDFRRILRAGSDSDSDCVEVRSDGNWYVYTCSTNQIYVCKQRI